MLNANVTLHEAVITSDKKQALEPREQGKQSVNSSNKPRGSSALATLFKEALHPLYLWMD